MFNLFKKKKNNDVIVLTKKQIKRLTEIDKLSEQEQNKLIHQQLAKRAKSESEKFSRLYYDEIKEMTANMTELFVQGRQEQNPHLKYEILTDARKAQDKFKDFCFSNGAGGADYFNESWLKVYNNLSRDLEEARKKI